MVASPNYLSRRFQPENPNQIWCGDLTYIRTAQGWRYLAQFIGSAAQTLTGKKIISCSFVAQSRPKYRDLARTNNRKPAPKSLDGNVFLAGKSARIFMPERFQNTTKNIV
ncbi:hypothetical protein AB204_19120 [Xenorhabdus khoisanae]|uniref:Transposase n=1 Tax=Xenorhabdus khoisanae TaxID=880157 RepID=A0A0J5IK63_9GAMM|nr:hypothetical protein AB204_19120 [Xenorhabdus khoisanae]